MKTNGESSPLSPIKTEVADYTHLLYAADMTERLKADEEVGLAIMIEEGRFAAQEMLRRQQAGHGPAELQELQATVGRGGRARDRLILSNLGLVEMWANRHLGHGVEFEDLVQVGIGGVIGHRSEVNTGLIRAADLFDYRRGIKFGSYASSWIRNAMQQTIADQRSTIRIAQYKTVEIKRYADTVREFEKNNTHVPTEDELMALLDCDRDKVRELAYIHNTYWRQGAIDSIDRLRSDEDDSYTLEIMDNSNDPGSDERIDSLEVESLLGRLTTRQQLVVRMSIGFTSDQRLATERLIANRIGYTVPAMRQDLQRALAILALPHFDPRKEYLHESATPLRHPGGLGERMLRHPLFAGILPATYEAVHVERAAELLSPSQWRLLLSCLRDKAVYSTSNRADLSRLRESVSRLAAAVADGEFNYAEWQTAPSAKRSVLGFLTLAGIEIGDGERLPELRQRALQKLNAISNMTPASRALVADYYGLHTGNPVSAEELARRTGTTVRNVSHLTRRAIRAITSQQRPEVSSGVKGRDYPVIEDIATVNFEAITELQQNPEMYITAERILATLSSMQAEVVLRRQRIVDGKAVTLAEVAADLQLSVSYVTATYSDAMKFIRLNGPSIAAGTFDYTSHEEANSRRRRTTLGFLHKIGAPIPAHMPLSQLNVLAEEIVNKAAMLSGTEKRLVSDMYRLQPSIPEGTYLSKDVSKRRHQLTVIQSAIDKMAGRTSMYRAA